MSAVASASRDAHELTSLLLPGQLLASRDADGRPMRLLFLAILHDAIDCFRKYLLDPSRRGRRLFAEAETWLMDDHASLPLRFETICDGLDLDATYVRRRLREWRAREVAQRARPPR
ncbi:MAG TPA: hypothetical protein VKU61_01890 [Candidatus Binatia bacterium]|nr:hypothetical protein [Candidatus Binatia bacterium]